MRSTLAACVAALSLAPLALTAQVPASEIRCNYLARTMCIKGACSPITTDSLIAGSFILLPSASQLLLAAHRVADNVVDVRLCDSDGCSPVPMRASIDGDWLYLLQANGGTQYVKIYLPADGTAQYGYVLGEFVELESFLLNTVIGNGTCRWPAT